MAVLSAVLVGCNKSQTEKPQEDTSFVGEVVSNVSDARNDPEKLAQLFTAEALPNEDWLAKAEGKSFVIDAVEVDGDEASVNVALEDHFGDPAGETTWKCIRLGETWKVSDAPLP